MWELHLGQIVRLKDSGLQLTELQLREYRLESGKTYRVTNVEIRSLRIKEHGPACRPNNVVCDCSWIHENYYFFCLDGRNKWVPGAYFEKVGE
ncbi:MAG: hypothetical protein C3F02_04480 [Parcubacteria group bacterium]|nr:MAG: hypothetical protein C3F02_04480 [Parcubacteria group bacterium]